jgi:hypothetical protein
VEGSRREGNGGWGVPVENRSSELVKLCCMEQSVGVFVWSKVVFFSANMEGSFCMGQGAVFLSKNRRDSLYGARCCFFEQKSKGLFVWGKVMFFSANMEGSFCMEQSGVFFGDYVGK